MIGPRRWMKRARRTGVAWGFCLTMVACAQVPRLNSLTPRWLQRGTTNTVTLKGENLAGFTEFLLSGAPGLAVTVVPAAAPTVTVVSDDDAVAVAADTNREVTVRVAVGPHAGLGARELRLASPLGVSNPEAVEVGSLPEVREVEPNNTLAEAQRVELPAVLNGVIDAPTEVDTFRFHVRKGEEYVFDVHANRFGSALDPSLRLLDAQGHELARGEDELGLDAFIAFAAPADQDCILQLRDFRFRGGPDFTYRLYAGALPYVDYFFPFGGRRGQTVAVAVRGRNLDGLKELNLGIAANAPLGLQEVRAHTPRGFTNARWLDVGAAPEFTETEPNDTAAQANTVGLPVSINGRIQADKDVDQFRFKVGPGETVVFEAYASVFGSPLIPLLTLTDAQGHVLQRNHEGAGRADARLEQTFAQAGDYVIAVSALLAGGGENYGYRLTARQPAPDFAAVCLVDTPRVHRGATAALRVEVRREGGFGGDVEIVPEALPAGVTCAPLVITPAFGGGTLMLSAAPQAALGHGRFRLRALGAMGGQRVARAVRPQAGDRRVKEAFVTVLEALPFQVEPLTLSATVAQSEGGAIAVEVTRQPGFTGEIRLALEGFSAGRDPITRSLETEPVTLKGVETRARLSFKARLDSELGTRPVWVRAESTVAGRAVSCVSRPVMFTADEFPFVLATSLPRVSVTAPAGGATSAANEAEFSVRAVRRGWFTDAITLALEGLPEGVTATATN